MLECVMIVFFVIFSKRIVSVDKVRLLVP